MDALQRLQPVDVLFAILWACIVGWGLQSGIVRQVGMLIGVYAAAVLSGSLYRDGAQALGMAFGQNLRSQLEVVAYILIFVLIFGLVALIIWRAYPLSRIARTFGSDNVLGGLIAFLNAVPSPITWAAKIAADALVILAILEGLGPTELAYLRELSAGDLASSYTWPFARTSRLVCRFVWVARITSCMRATSAVSVSGPVSRRWLAITSSIGATSSGRDSERITR